MADQTTSRNAIPYGAWPSPVTAEMITAQTVRLSQPGSDGDTRYWLESRASEGGRMRLMREMQPGSIEAITPDHFNVRSGVHEYGGGAWAAASGIVVVSNYDDHRLYHLDDKNWKAITPDNPMWRFADLLVDPKRNRLFAVREDHSLEDAEPVNTLVALTLDGANDDGGKVIVSGSDFVASATLSHDASQLAWLSWNHPLMPWDGCELWKADIAEDGTLTRLRHVAGDARGSIFQPRWAENGDLVFVSDRSGWWNLYRARPGIDEITPLCPMEAEFGLPQWSFGMSTWDFAPDGSITCAWTNQGEWHIGHVPAEGGELDAFPSSFTTISDVHVQPATNEVLFIGSSPSEPPQIISLDLESASIHEIRKSMDIALPGAAISEPEAISWPTPDGATAHGFFYPPTSESANAPDDESPPLIVKSHGGPTGMSTPDFDLSIQFWTSRGFAVLDVNYGGSTGYGRAYRERLLGKWGIVDVEDCIAGATFLAGSGKVDGARMAINGGSAGGYTTLAALAFHNAFRSGVSSYGIGDLEAMATDTHKFESRYLDSLVGAYPEQKDIYKKRSPIHHVELLSSAMLLFQGRDDKVVPPAQAEKMAEAVRANGLPVALLMFEGEGHGFRREETIHRVLEAELSFHSQIFGFPHPEVIPRLHIENLPEPN